MIYKGDTRAREQRESMRGGEGTVVLTKLCDDLPQNARLFSRITLEPGVSIGYHVHENETELFCFYSGSGRVKDDERWVEITAGDTMMTPSGHGHCVENTGETDLVLLAVIVKD